MVSVIIHCFEILIERPSSSLRAGALTLSTYTHHNAVKYFIGIHVGRAAALCTNTMALSAILIIYCTVTSDV